MTLNWYVNSISLEKSFSLTLIYQGDLEYQGGLSIGGGPKYSGSPRLPKMHSGEDYSIKCALNGLRNVLGIINCRLTYSLNTFQCVIFLRYEEQPVYFDACPVLLLFFQTHVCFVRTRLSSRNAKASLEILNYKLVNQMDFSNTNNLIRGFLKTFIFTSKISVRTPIFYKNAILNSSTNKEKRYCIP